MNASSDYAALDALGLRASILAGERTPADAVREAFERIEALDGELGAFLTTERASAERRADELARERAAGRPPGALFGVPVALKANMCHAGFVTSCASRILAGWRAPYSATFVERLLDAGAIPIGTTNMDEFAMGSSSENSAHFPSRNPWDTTRTPGGSSSGSAVAVAAGLTPIALGSDTGGSVRQPAALCGIYGLKPTYGRVSRYGLVAFGSSLDQVSPFARSVRDLEAVLGAISGADPRDSTCRDLAPFEPRKADGEPRATEPRLDGLRVGVPRQYLPESLDADVRAVVEAGLERLRGLGCELVPIELPHTAYAIPTYYVVAAAEASSNLARYDGVRYGLRVAGGGKAAGTLDGMYAATREAGFGDEVKRRILLGTYVLSAGYYDAWYGRALMVRGLVKRDFDEAFGAVDVIAGPTAPSPAFRLGEKADDPVAMYASDAMTVPTSLAGLPGLSVPCGFVEQDGSALPVGLQLVAPQLAEDRILRVARALEALQGPLRRPDLAHLARGARS